MRFDRRIFLLALLTGAPGTLVALGLLWRGDFGAVLCWTLTLLLGLLWFGLAAILTEKVRYPLHTVANVLASMREGDYSIRGRGAKPGDPLGEVMLEVNALGEHLRAQRLGALEATALLGTVMSEIEVAVFTFDGSQRLRLVNRAGEKLLAQSPERLLGRTAKELGLSECLEGEAQRTFQAAFPGGLGRWGLRRTSFREEGAPHQLVVLTDLSRTLREEERQAWQRLVRVIGHELNNSLAPVKSIAGSLETILKKDPPPPDWQEDLQRGLSIISARAEGLTRFMAAYAQLARLPQPQYRLVRPLPLMQRVAGLETRVTVQVVPGPDLEFQADSDQLEQLFINLVRNAADAALQKYQDQLPAGKSSGTPPEPSVTITWSKAARMIEFRVEDNGSGLSNTANLFVPFFTTKPTGSGIGLVLSRQIAEAHGGTLVLENRAGSEEGCVARLRLSI